MKNKIFFRVFLLVVSLSYELTARPIVVGSKIMTESRVLGEIVTEKIRSAGVEVEHKEGLGGTVLLWRALCRETL